MRYSEWLGSIVATTATTTLTGAYLWLSGSHATELWGEIYLLEVTSAAIGALTARHVLKNIASSMKQSYLQKNTGNEEKADDAFASSIITPKKSFSTHWHNHVGNAIERSIDRIDRGDTKRGIAQTTTSFLFTIFSTVTVKKQFHQAVQDSLATKACFPGFLRQRIAASVADFMCNEVIATVGEEITLPQFLKN